MNIKSNLENKIRLAANQKSLPSVEMTNEVIAQMFDDRLDIIGDIMKHENDPATLGKILISQLNETVREVVYEYESLEIDK